MSIIRWEDPPVKTAGNESRWRRIADELRSRPRSWALVGEYGTRKLALDSSSLIRTGARAGMPEGEFEAEVVKTADGHALYARYVGHTV